MVISMPTICCYFNFLSFICCCFGAFYFVCPEFTDFYDIPRLSTRFLLSVGSTVLFIIWSCSLLLHILFIFFSRYVVFLFYKYFRLCFIFFDYSFESVLNVSIVCLSICCYALLGGCHSQVGFHRYWLLFIQTTSVLMKSNCTETLFNCPK